MANVVSEKLEQAIQIKDQIRIAANAKNAAIPEDAPFADYPGYLNNLPDQLGDVPIVLDFTNGDQTVTTDDGYVAKSAVIQKPDTLIPENIAEGVDIAGIVGALAAGGGSAKFAIGSFTGNGGVVTVSHGMGVAPDLVLVFGAVTSATASAYYLGLGWGMSTAFKSLSGFSANHKGIRAKSAANLESYSFGSGIDADVENLAIKNATATSIQFGSTSGGTAPTGNGISYVWLAVGGLA